MSRSRRFRGEAQSVSAAREFVRDALQDQSREVLEAAELMVSELATNCVLHARTDFELAIQSRGEIRVEVRDTGPGQPVPQSPKPQEPSGRGLRIVEAMSSTWGVVPSRDGKTVWFTLAEQPALGGEAVPAGHAAGVGERSGDREDAGDGTQPAARTPRRIRRTPRAAVLPSARLVG
jgi:anti-sigma regulatory factor (Ser/Thr protein kinase)